MAFIIAEAKQDPRWPINPNAISPYSLLESSRTPELVGLANYVMNRNLGVVLAQHFDLQEHPDVWSARTFANMFCMLKANSGFGYLHVFTGLMRHSCFHNARWEESPGKPYPTRMVAIGDI